MTLRNYLWEKLSKPKYKEKFYRGIVMDIEHYNVNGKNEASIELKDSDLDGEPIYGPESFATLYLPGVLSEEIPGLDLNKIIGRKALYSESDINMDSDGKDNPTFFGFLGGLMSVSIEFPKTNSCEDYIPIKEYLKRWYFKRPKLPELD